MVAITNTVVVVQRGSYLADEWVLLRAVHSQFVADNAMLVLDLIHFLDLLQSELF